MKNLVRTLVTVFFVVAIVGTSKRAHALGPIGLEAGAMVGYGTNPDSSGPVNPLGIGIGARAGVVLMDSLYGGVKIMDYLGGSESVLGQSYTVHALQYGIDVGYGFSIPLLTIRPQVGVGNIGFSTNFPGASTQSSLYIEPGVVGLIGLGLLYVGADVNYMLMTSYPEGTDASGNATTGTKGALTIHAQIGIKL